MTIDRAKAEDFDQLKALWKEVFDEEPAFLEHFFSARFQPQHIFVARADDKIVSALHAMPSTYLQNGKSLPCSYIVGAATYKLYRRQGIMGKLLQATVEAYDHPITLFPAVRPFYEANGYFTTSSLYSYDLTDFEGPVQASLVLEDSRLNDIYLVATRQSGALVRDELAWKSLVSGYETIAVEGAYAFIKDTVAVEAMADSAEAAFALLCILSEKHIKSVQVQPKSLFIPLLGNRTYSIVPMGMSTSRAMRGVYIAEQY